MPCTLVRVRHDDDQTIVTLGEYLQLPDGPPSVFGNAFVPLALVIDFVPWIDDTDLHAVPDHRRCHAVQKPIQIVIDVLLRVRGNETEAALDECLWRQLAVMGVGVHPLMQECPANLIRHIWLDPHFKAGQPHVPAMEQRKLGGKLNRPC